MELVTYEELNEAKERVNKQIDDFQAELPNLNKKLELSFLFSDFLKVWNTEGAKNQIAKGSENQNQYELAQDKFIKQTDTIKDIKADYTITVESENMYSMY